MARPRRPTLSFGGAGRVAVAPVMAAEFVSLTGWLSVAAIFAAVSFCAAGGGAAGVGDDGAVTGCTVVAAAATAFGAAARSLSATTFVGKAAAEATGDTLSALPATSGTAGDRSTTASATATRAAHPPAASAAPSLRRLRCKSATSFGLRFCVALQLTTRGANAAIATRPLFCSVQVVVHAPYLHVSSSSASTAADQTTRECGYP